MSYPDNLPILGLFSYEGLVGDAIAFKAVVCYVCYGAGVFSRLILFTMYNASVDTVHR